MEVRSHLTQRVTADQLPLETESATVMDVTSLDRNRNDAVVQAIRETLVEHTAFVWAAAQEVSNFTFDLATATCRNEAPPSLVEITQQRRRWAAGNLDAATALPPGYQVLTRIRNYAWALSPVVTLVVVPLSLLGLGIVGGGLLLATSLGLGAFTLFWYLRGVLYYGREGAGWALALPLAPVVTVVHSMGTVVGILDPPGKFRVTEKVGR